MQKLQRYNTLFTRLLLSFFAVLLVPTLILSFYYGVIGKRMVLQSLQKQGEISCAYSAQAIQDIIGKYWHTAYLLAKEPLITDLLTSNIPLEDLPESRPIYEILFSLMKGELDFAAAHFVSSSGKVRCSTHAFPSSYDLRYNRNDDSPLLDFEQAKKDAPSFITINNRYVNNNSMVYLNLFRRVKGTDKKDIGYVAIDIFQRSFWNINKDFLFDDLILVDTTNYFAASIIHNDRYGSFAKFDSLNGLRFSSEKNEKKDTDYTRVVRAIEDTPLILVGVINNRHYLANVQNLYVMTPFIILAGLIVAGIIAFILSRVISKPVNDLIGSMRKGKLTANPKHSGIYELALLNSAFNNMILQLESLMEAERKALESQLNPHFLYNTLNMVKSIAKLHNEQEILTIIIKLGKLLRSSIDNTKTEVTIKESITLVEDYLTIQHIRFGNKLKVQILVDEQLQDVLTPKFIFQPLVENALVHGLSEKLGDWLLDIEVRTDGKTIFIRIFDNGVGIPDGIIPQDLSQLEGSGHVGIYNIYRRLELRYARNFSFKINSKLGEGTCLSISLPLNGGGHGLQSNCG